MTGPHTTPQPRFARVAIAGIGLLGGSLAAAIKAGNLAGSIVGIGRNPQRLKAAQNAGLIDEYSVDLPSAAQNVDLLVLCTPVERIVEELNEVAGHCRPGTLITDVGSVKRSICAAARHLPAEISFVGSHPLAGSEKRGFEHSDESLFQDRLCILTPTPDTPAAAVDRVRDFWSAVGMQTKIMEPDEHDRALAATSHLPHLVAAALTGSLPSDFRELTATGFRDTTRIAAGDPEMWLQIFLGNRDSLAEALDRFLRVLGEFQTSLQHRDANGLRSLLQQAKETRDRLEPKSG